MLGFFFFHNPAFEETKVTSLTHKHFLGRYEVSDADYKTGYISSKWQGPD